MQLPHFIKKQLTKLGNSKYKYLYSNPDYRHLKSLIKDRNNTCRLEEDTAFLFKLHQFFPKPKPMVYDYQSLVKRAHLRYKFLETFNIDCKGKSLLDIGAGHGENLFVGVEYGITEATGIDYSKQRFDSHSEKIDKKLLNKIDYIEGNVEQITVDESRYDIIISINSFEHFLNPPQVLKLCLNALKAGGYIFIHFNPLFHSPYGAHRYGDSGVPYIQNIFKNETAYNFFYHTLKITDGRNRYTNQDPYPEMNKWTYSQFINLFTDTADMQIVAFRKEWNYEYYWMTKLFKNQLKDLTKEDLFISGLKIILKKPE